MDQEPQKPAGTATFWECLGTYRDQLGSPQFASGILDECEATGDKASQLARLHVLAAEGFEEQATWLAARAERVDAYERGAYGEPLVNGVMLTVLVATTLGFSLVVLTRMRVAGAVLLVVTLGLNAAFVRMWRRPPYGYEGEYRKPWDDIASLARHRAEQARRASLVTGVPAQDLPTSKGERLP